MCTTIKVCEVNIPTFNSVHECFIRIAHPLSGIFVLIDPHTPIALQFIPLITLWASAKGQYQFSQASTLIVLDLCHDSLQIKWKITFMLI